MDLTSPRTDDNLTFDRLLQIGLRPGHSVLEVGCGELKIGRYLIGYLGKTSYFGIDPRKSQIESGTRDLPSGLIGEKRPQFSTDDSFNVAGIFAASFDIILVSSFWIDPSPRQIESLRQSFDFAGTSNVIILEGAEIERAHYNLSNHVWAYS